MKCETPPLHIQRSGFHAGDAGGAEETGTDYLLLNSRQSSVSTGTRAPGIAARRSAVVSTDPRPILNWPPPGTMPRDRGVPRKMSGYLPGVGAIRRRQNGSVLRPHRVHRARQEFRRSGTDASPAGPTFLLIRSASLRRFGSNAFAVPSRRRLRRPVSRCRPTGVTTSMRACWNSYGLRWVQPGAGT